MKHRLILFFSMALLLSATMQAAGKYLHPAPQQMSATGDSISIPTDYRMYVFEEGADEPALKLLYSFLPYSAEKAGFGIYVGARGDKSVKKFSRNIPQKAEGYYLKIDDNNIVVAGADRRGLFYGVQTLLQLAENGKLPAVEITDYPDVPYRGVVEGFYGKPWSHMARLRQLEFYGRNKMNVYIYGPKDDPYHRTPDWRIPYPEEEAERMMELVQAATDNNVIFYWAIHPGQDIKWNDEDRDNLLQKFEHMYQLGVRGFAVFFDDISGEGTKADKQAELLNYIDDNFIQTKHDVAPLIMCPTEYNKSWTKLEGGYLATLGERLNGDIHIMWTGDKVVETIDMETLDFVNPLIKRKAFIWWNFPVSDYVQPHLLMGEVYGNGLDIKDDISAFVSNPMEYAEASKIAIQSIADYTWNMEAYDSRESWLQAIRDLMPENAEYLKTFVSHNSDLGPNGHNFQRMESEEIAPALDTLLNEFRDNGTVNRRAYEQVARECNNIITASYMLLTAEDNRPLAKEIKPWLRYFRELGEYGCAVLDMVRTAAEKDTESFEAAYRRAKALRTIMQMTDDTSNRDHRQPGVKCGTKRLLPAFDSLFEIAVRK